MFLDIGRQKASQIAKQIGNHGQYAHAKRVRTRSFCQGATAYLASK